MWLDQICHLKDKYEIFLLLGPLLAAPLLLLNTNVLLAGSKWRKKATGSSSLERDLFANIACVHITSNCNQNKGFLKFWQVEGTSISNLVVKFFKSNEDLINNCF